ncbi:MAG: hypothetical protein ABJH06_09650 [Paraglaciecola sp.]|uniref:hypothetical protein n=1 Tax=Paraglaciecola sp. TaxID=1920173 RepID=UPI003264ED9E
MTLFQQSSRATNSLLHDNQANQSTTTAAARVCIKLIFDLVAVPESRMSSLCLPYTVIFSNFDSSSEAAFVSWAKVEIEVAPKIATTAGNNKN